MKKPKRTKPPKRLLKLIDSRARKMAAKMFATKKAKAKPKKKAKSVKGSIWDWDDKSDKASDSEE